MALFWKETQKPKVCVLGLAGFPLSLLEDLLNSHSMPGFTKLLSEGNLTPIKPVYPITSSVTWTTFMTGANPGIHGVFGFPDLKVGSYSLKTHTIEHCKVPTLWDRLGSMEKRSVIINQPAIFPAKKLSGAMIAGSCEQDLFKAIYPGKYIRQLRRKKYHIDINSEEITDDIERLVSNLSTLLKDRSEAVELLWKSEKWDYFEVIITGTDRLFHRFWNILNETASDAYNLILTYLKQLDDFIVNLATKFKKKTKQKSSLDGFYVFSNHGFSELLHEVDINTWLNKNGFLDYTTDNPLFPESISPTTRAFALKSGRIYLHTKNRFPAATMTLDEAEKVKKKLIIALKNLSFNGEKVISSIYNSNELYSGPLVSQSPDLILVPNDGFELIATFSKKDVFNSSVLTGMHSSNPGFCLSNVFNSDAISLEEITQSIIQHF